MSDDDGDPDDEDSSSSGSSTTSGWSGSSTTEDTPAGCFYPWALTGDCGAGYRQHTQGLCSDACVPLEYICDGFEDCVDGSDEDCD